MTSSQQRVCVCFRAQVCYLPSCTSAPSSSWPWWFIRNLPFSSSRNTRVFIFWPLASSRLKSRINWWWVRDVCRVLLACTAWLKPLVCPAGRSYDQEWDEPSWCGVSGSWSVVSGSVFQQLHWWIPGVVDVSGKILHFCLIWRFSGSRPPVCFNERVFSLLRFCLCLIWCGTASACVMRSPLTCTSACLRSNSRAPRPASDIIRLHFHPVTRTNEIIDVSRNKRWTPMSECVLSLGHFSWHYFKFKLAESQAFVSSELPTMHRSVFWF